MDYYKDLKQVKKIIKYLTKLSTSKTLIYRIQFTSEDYALREGKQV